MNAERKRDETKKAAIQEPETDALDLSACDAGEIEDGEIQSEDSGAGSFLDRFLPPRDRQQGR